MGYYSDPTAARALGGINREFARLDKKARAIRRRWEAGEITDQDLAQAHSQFRGIYRHVLANVLKEDWDNEAPHRQAGGDEF